MPQSPRMASLPTENLLTTRLAPAGQNNKLLERADLLAVCLDAVSVQLVLVEAPAGFGKTTSLAQWRDKLLQRGTPVAWLNLDDEDKSPAELLNYIEHALRAAGLQTDGDRAASEGFSDCGAQQKMRRLLNAIAEAKQPIVIMLDELEHAPPALCGSVIEPLIRRAPPNLQLVLASRTRPKLRVAALRARGLVLNLGAAELRFRTDEIAQLFDCKLTRRELAAVAQETDGWPVAVQLLRSAWTGGAQAASVERSSAIANIIDYVSEEVLAPLAPDHHSTLQEVTVLDRLSADAVAAVTGRSDTWPQLIVAEWLQPFLLPIERNAAARRMHPILHTVLAAEFARADVSRRSTVLRAAARWYATQGELARAVSYALECEDLNLAGRLILNAGGVRLWIRRGKAVTKAINALLTEPLLDRFPRIRLLRALVLIKDGELSAAGRSFDQVRSITADFTTLPDDGEIPALLQDRHIVEATLLFNECRPAGDAYLESLERAMREVAEDDHLLQGSLRNLLCVAYTQRGLFDKAVPAAHAAIDQYQQADSTHGQLFEHLHLGNIAFARGMPAMAKAAYARAREMARRHFSDDQTKSALLSALSAELAYEQNLIGQSLRQTRQAAQHIRHIELWYDIYAAQFVTSAMIALERGGIADALAILESARQEANGRNAAGVTMLLDATKVSCLALRGAVEEAHDVLLQRKIDLAAYLKSDKERMWREREAVLVAALRVAARKPVVSVPVALVEEALSRLWSEEQIRAAIRLGATFATFYWHLERPAQALGHLDTALRASQRSGYIRVFVEDRECVRPVLEHWRMNVRESTEPELARHVDALLVALAGGGVTSTSTLNLTPREDEILQEMSRGLSDKEIARSLRMSENTVKFHVKHLYAKLQVGRRIDAVQQARRRGILH